MEIDIYDEDFSSDDISDVDNLDELKDMSDELWNAIYDVEDRLSGLKQNQKIVEKRIQEIGNDEN